MSNKELIALSLSEIGELEDTMQNHSTVAPHNHEPLLGKFFFGNCLPFWFSKNLFLITIFAGTGDF